MEMRSTREMRRNEQLNKVISKKPGTTDAPVQAQTTQRQAPKDKLSLSQQALAYLDEQKDRLTQELEDRRTRQERYLADCQNKSDELDLLSKQMDVLDKCLKIAASIIKGNRVPTKDLEFLMKNDPDGYRLALALRRENPDPKDEKSVLDNEEGKNDSVEESGGEESPSVSASEMSSGGGETSAAAE